MAEEHDLLCVPEALEEQILVRVPVKSIVRFKSVCKSWHSMFRSKAFAEFYFGLRDIEAFIPTSKDLDLISRGIIISRCTMSVIGPLSNGIYALTSSGGYVRNLKIALFNPATKRLEFAVSFPDEYLDLLSGIKSCDVSCGIDDAYRVVVLIKYGGCILVFLYMWRMGEWKKLVDYDPMVISPRTQATDVFKKRFRLSDDMMACSQKLLNGCWHWMIEQRVKEEGETRFGVLSFDFERKSFELIRGPPCKATGKFQGDVFVLQDHLAAIVEDYNTIGFPRFDIWRNTKNAWNNIYSVKATQFIKCLGLFVDEVDYYQVEEEEVRIRRLILVDDHHRYTFEDDKGLLMKKFNRKISLSIGGSSKFAPTFEPLPLRIPK